MSREKEPSPPRVHPPPPGYPSMSGAAPVPPPHMSYYPYLYGPPPPLLAPPPTTSSLSTPPRMKDDDKRGGAPQPPIPASPQAQGRPYSDSHHSQPSPTAGSAQTNGNMSAPPPYAHTTSKPPGAEGYADPYRLGMGKNGDPSAYSLDPWRGPPPPPGMYGALPPPVGPPPPGMLRHPREPPPPGYWHSPGYVPPSYWQDRVPPPQPPPPQPQPVLVPVKKPMERINEVDGRIGATSPSQIETTHRDEVQNMGCTCKKTRCLKLYCQCFGAKLTCGSNCRCLTCYNTDAHDDVRREAMQNIILRNPGAFDTKFKKSGANATTVTAAASEGNASTRILAHKLGCKCRKSSCMKKVSSVISTAIDRTSFGG